MFNFSNQSAVANNAPKVREQSEFWLNVGYEANGQFIGIGVPLDVAPSSIKAGSLEFAQILEAQQDLREQLITACKELAPGEAMILEGNICGLQIQLRRRKGEVVATGENPFIRKIGA